MEESILCWFKRDLRVADHPALALAAALGAVVPIYIVEPDYWALPDTSGRQFAFLSECLDDLRKQLARIGLPLVVRRGEAVAVLEDLRRQTGAVQMVSHEETGNAWTYERDIRVGAWARAQGVAWHEVPQCAVVRRLRNRGGWAARRTRFVDAPSAVLEGVRAGVSVRSDAMGSGPPDPCPERQFGGRAQAMKVLDSFLRERGEFYQSGMATPIAGARVCSRLSPHLAFGTLSIREAAQAGARRAAGVGGQKGWPGSMRAFQSRLAWRDHFMQKLEDQPEMEYRCLHPAYEGLRAVEPDAERLRAWSVGETGMPFVDACMRSLAATGWLNFRMRSMVMAVASYHLWLDWRATGAVLARLFTDYEPGIHWPQCQMQSGVTGMNTLRVYNPVKQGHDQDPEGAFIRHWVPELAAVPAGFVHQPWLWPQFASVLDGRYPMPIVDPQRAGIIARDRVWAVRQAGGFGPMKRAIVAKHVGKGRAAAPAPRRAPVTNAQLGFDFT